MPPRHPLLARASLAAALLLACAAPLPALAHGGSAHDESATAASMATMTGRVDAITVTARATGTTQRFPILALADGRRVRLENAAAAATGMELTVTGRLQGKVLTAESLASPAAAAGTVAPRSLARGELTGTLRMFHVDYPDGHSEYGYSLIPDAGGVNIVDLGTTLPLANGARATIAGPIRAGGYIEVDTIVLDAAPETTLPGANAMTSATPAAVTTGYTVVPLLFPTNTTAPYTYGSAPVTIATIQSNIFGVGTTSVADYYKEVSYGAQLLSGAVASVGGTSWFQATVPRPPACGTSAELNDVLNTMNSQADVLVGAATLNSRPGILYIANSLTCGWSGLGYIGWARAYTNGSAGLLVVGHEFGHNFGLYHAGSVACGSAVIAASGCTVTEYGDRWDIMGNVRAGHFNAYQKDYLAYVPASAVAEHAGGSATYNLGPLESPGQALYAIRIPTSNASRTYWVEFRRPIGFDNAIPASIGAQVRLSVPFENNGCSGCASGMYDDTQLLDLTPGDSNMDNGTLAVGATYTDPTYNVTIQVLSGSATTLAVKVSTGGASASTTTLASSLNPSGQGQSVTFTATVSGVAPTGTVAFKDAGATLGSCGAVALTGAGDTRTATCATTALVAGTHAITADYAGDAGNGASSSAALTQTVKVLTTTTVTSSQNPSLAAAGVTFTASITGSAPGGTVTFNADGAAIGGCATVAVTGSGNTRIATCTTSALTVGAHPIVASYGGDAANAASTSSTLTQTVTGATATTTTGATTSLNPAGVGASVTFTAAVTGNLPTGNVTFTADGAGIPGCATVALAGSGNTRTAICVTAGLAAGVHEIVASYGGNAQNAPSTSPTLTQTITGGSPGGTVATATTVTSSSNPSPQGANVALTATVAAQPAVGSGYVTFTAAGATIPGCGAVTVVANGALRTATCNTGAFAPGAYSIVASYSGDAGSQPSTSPVFSQVIPFAATGNAVQFAAPAYALSESGGSVTLAVTRIGDVSAPASVDYATAGGSAAADVDYSSRTGTLSWPAHDASTRLVTVPITDDALGETNETFTVTLANAVGAVLGANATTTVTIIDNENATLAMPGTATIVQNPYGAVTVIGATLSGNVITGLARGATIRLGTTAGTAGSFAKIDFAGFTIGPANALSIQSGAAGQTVYLANVDAAAALVSGYLQVSGANGAPPPMVVLVSEAGLNVTSAGSIVAPAGLAIDTLGTPSTTGGDVQNQGLIDGGPLLRINAAKVNGGGRFAGNAIQLATFGNLNNPVNGAHYLGNGLQLYPSSGNDVALAVAGYGLAPQFMNLTVNGNATFSMPSLWSAGATLPSTNRPVLPGEVRPAGTPDPAYGGGSIIVQATGNLVLDGGLSQDLVFPGGIALKAGGTFDVHGAAIDNGWTTSGQAFQGLFIEAAQIVDSTAAAALEVRTNNKNWANFSVRPLLPVRTWTLQLQFNATQVFVPADAAAPHLNIYSAETEAGAAGQCWTCLVNPQAIDFAAP